MRHLTIILTCVLQLMCLPLYSQQKGISIDMHDAPVEEIFNEIEEQTGYFFLYSKTILDAEWKTSLTVVDKDLAYALNSLFSGTGISYALQNRQIVLSKQEPKPDKATSTSLIDVNGAVQNENGVPLEGAVIVTPDGSAGTISDANGRFHLQVERGTPLQISLLGYVAQSVRAYPGEINVTLEEDTRLLDDIVVVGYGTTSRKNLTTSISRVETDNINKAANSNMSQLLLGRAAGLNATVSSAQPGGNVRLSIRGASNPIFIVDGIMMPSGSLEIGAGEIGVPNSIDRAGLAGLNPHDIESVEILKDAAASIYGIGAANGVVLITTKKGSSGRPKVELESNFSIVQNHKYLDMLDGREYMNFANMFSKENYLYNNKQGAYGETPYDGGWFPLFTPAQIEEAGTTDWQDYILKLGTIVNQNITVTGGSDAFRYYLGGNYYNYDGSVANAGMERFSLRTNISSQILPFLKLTAIANINQNDYNNSSVGSDAKNQGAHGSGALQAALAYPSYIPLKDENGDYSIYTNMPNPQAMLSINDRTKTSGYYVNFAADLDIIKDMLSFRGIYGTNRESGNRELYIPSDLYFGQMYKSRGHIGYSSRYNWTLEGTLNFSKMFADVVQVDAVVGMGKYMDGFSYLDVSYENAHDLINNDNIGAAEGPHYPVSGRGKNEKRSQFGRVSADILNRYVISATLRRDGTDKFFPDSKYALFPSVSIAWKLSNESFMKNISWMDLVKLRASYGETGIDELAAGALYGSYNPSDFYVKFDGNATTYIPYIQSGANYPDVTWTKTIMKNVGIDFSLLNDRISGSFDIFRNDITRLIAWIPLSPLGMYGGEHNQFRFQLGVGAYPLKIRHTLDRTFT